jgi:ABC-type Na+ efflux pump permease subunit
MILLPQLIPSAEADFSDLEPMLAALPPALQAQIQGLTFDQIWIVFASNYLFAPLFLVVPLMVSSIIGSDSFVGEKERGTMEALFFTPISDTELFVAKLLTAFVPAQIIALASFVVYGFVVNLSGYGAIGPSFPHRHLGRWSFG